MTDTKATDDPGIGPDESIRGARPVSDDDDTEGQGTRYGRVSADAPGPEGTVRGRPITDDDTEGQGLRHPQPAPTDDDTEGQMFVLKGWSNRDLKEDIEPLDQPDEAPAPVDEPDDDTEGQLFLNAKGWSNRDLKEDIEPLDAPEAEVESPDAVEDSEPAADPADS